MARGLLHDGHAGVALDRAYRGIERRQRVEVGQRGFSYKRSDAQPEGILVGKLREGAVDGATKLKVKGKGDLLNLPDLNDLNGVLKVQLQKADGSVCWGATFSPPFIKHDAALMRKLDGSHDWFTMMCSGGFRGQLSLDVRDAIRFWIAAGAANDCP